MTNPHFTKTDRRVILKWLFAGIGTSPVLAACYGPFAAFDRTTLLGTPKPINGSGYGTDPNLVDPVIPWDLTMTSEQSELVTALTDLVLPESEDLPSGSMLGVPDFINEWVSSPYQQTQEDREKLFGLFEWFEGEARRLWSVPFAASTNGQKVAVLDRIAWSERVEGGLEDMASAFDCFRNLAVSAYFATEEGGRWLGYMGNQPTTGDYAGPTLEALEHLEAALKKLELKMPKGL